MNKKIIVFLTCTIIATSAISYTFVSADDSRMDVYNINNQSDLEHKNSYGVNDLKESLSETVQKVKEMNLVDKEVEKWYIRVYGDAKLANKNMSEKEITEKVNTIMKTRSAWVEFAEKEYHVTIQDKELNQYINEQKILFQDKLVEVYEGLGLTVDEFFYEFEYDNFKRNLIWIELKPLLEEKNPIATNEDLLDYNNRLLNIYSNEVDIYLAK